MRMPDDITVDPGGINDTVVPFIEAINSYDGRTPFEVVTTPWRTVCGNTERFSVRDAMTRWKVRHTRNATTRIHEARRTLGLTHAYYQQWSAEETALARTDVAINEFDALVDTLWPVEPDATARTRRTAQARRDRLHDLLDAETERTGRTAYAAERAVTDYTDHFAAVRPSAASGLKGDKDAARGLRLLEGTDDDLKTKAHRHLMLLRRT
jgi:phage/plasmid-like protein (TIGR03299 family)